MDGVFVAKRATISQVCVWTLIAVPIGFESDPIVVSAVTVGDIDAV
jgi:hypothetical protein